MGINRLILKTPKKGLKKKKDRNWRPPKSAPKFQQVWSRPSVSSVLNRYCWRPNTLYHNIHSSHCCRTYVIHNKWPGWYIFLHKSSLNLQREGTTCVHLFFRYQGCIFLPTYWLEECLFERIWVFKYPRKRKYVIQRPIVLISKALKSMLHPALAELFFGSLFNSMDVQSMNIINMCVLILTLKACLWFIMSY